MNSSFRKKVATYRMWVAGSALGNDWHPSVDAAYSRVMSDRAYFLRWAISYLRHEAHRRLDNLKWRLRRHQDNDLPF